MVAERTANTPYDMPTDSPYVSALDEYDLNIRNMNSTGNVGVDAELNHMISQTHRVKEACSCGFRHMDQITRDLNEYVNRNDSSMIYLRSAQDEEFKKMRDQIYNEIKTDKMPGATIGNKVGRHRIQFQ